jgi:hypothetical protein
MRTDRLVLAGALAIVLTAGAAVGAQFNFGGDLGFYLFDVSRGSGIRPGLDTAGTRVGIAYGDTTGRVNTQLKDRGLGVYWNVLLTDQVSIHILTEVGSTSTGATPVLGIKLGAQQGGAGTVKPLAIPEANIQLALPWEVQMTTGLIRPIFSEDYGEKKGYQEGNRLFRSSANAYGGEWHDLGIELYKSFEPGGGFSIPAYAYVLSGVAAGGEVAYGDDNSNKGLMLHVAPSFWKLRVLGSFGFGEEGADGESKPWSRYAAGLGSDFGKFWLRGEFFGGSWAGNEVLNAANKDSLGNIVPDTVAFKPVAYYVKAGCNLIPDKLGLVLTYDQYSPDWTTRGKLGYTTQSGSTTDANESYTTIGASVQYWVIPGSAIMIEYNRGMWKVGDGSLDKIDFNRITLGWRTVF